jgi:hypothetical protein
LQGACRDSSIQPDPNRVEFGRQPRKYRPGVVPSWWRNADKTALGLSIAGVGDLIFFLDTEGNLAAAMRYDASVV